MASVRQRWSPATPAFLAGVLLALAALAVFWPVLDNGFVAWDDKEYVVANPVVREGLSLRGIAWAATTFSAGNWHPLTWLSHMADVSVFGMNPRGHHLTSMLIHAVNGALLFLALRGLTGTFWRPAFAAALFALHPLRVESVAWVAERKDVLAGSFFLISLLAYRRYVARPGTMRYLALASCFALGLTAKPMLVTLPCVLLFLDYWPLCRFAAASPVAGARRRGASLLLEKAPLVALSCVAGAVTYAAQGGAVQGLDKIPVAARLANAAVSVVLYLRDALWPSRLAFIYSYPVSGHAAFGIGAAVAVLAGVTAVAVVTRKTRPSLAVGWLWYLAMLVPVIGIVQVGLQARADRYTYLPMIGMSLALLWAFPARAGHGRVIRAATPAALALCLALAAAARVQVLTWRDNETLFRRALAAAPDNWVAESKLGMLRAMQGRDDEALRHYRAATALAPDYAEPHVNAGILLERQGRAEEALREYLQALRAEPGNVHARASAGVLLCNKGRSQEAAVHFREAIRREPREARHRLNLGMALSGSGDFAGAEASYRESLRLDPEQLQAHNNLGIVLMARGRNAEALEHFLAASRLDPQQVLPRYNIALTLERSGKPAEAAGQYREVLRLNPDFTGAREGLARTSRALAGH